MTRYPVHLVGDESLSEQIFAVAYNYGVLRIIQTENVEWAGMRDPKSTSLAHREVKEPSVGSQAGSILKEDRSRILALSQWKFKITTDLHCMTPDESSVVTIWDKADLLAVPLSGCN